MHQPEIHYNGRTQTTNSELTDNDIDTLLDSIAGSTAESHSNCEVREANMLRSGTLPLPLLLAERVVNTICSSRSFPSTIRNVEAADFPHNRGTSLEVPPNHELSEDLDQVASSRPDLFEAYVFLFHSILK